jgi:sugar phosphate isomerase/epimerase
MAAAAGATAAAINPEMSLAGCSGICCQKLKLGVTSFTFRKFDLDETISMTQKLGLKYISLKSVHMPMDASPAELKTIAKKVKDAGLTMHGGGVIKMKSKDEIDQAFEYAKNAGLPMMVISPNPELLPLIDKKVKQYDISVAIHNHGPGDDDYPTPMAAYKEIKKYDERIGFCHDIGHTKRLGIDPVEETIKCYDRILDVHFKDVTAATKEGHSCITGRGIIDIVKVLRLLVDKKYDRIVTFEYEKEDPFVSLAESIGYTKGVLAAI